MRKVQATVHTVDQAIKKSEDAINVFTSTVTQLKEANERLQNAREVDLERINAIELNVQRSNDQETVNNKLIMRINAILGGKNE